MTSFSTSCWPCIDYVISMRAMARGACDGTHANRLFNGALLHNSCLPGHVPAAFHSFTWGRMSSPQLLYSLGYSMQMLCWLEECNYYEQYCWLDENLREEESEIKCFYVIMPLRCNWACGVGLIWRKVLTLRWQFLLLFGQWQTLLWLLQRHGPLSASSWCSWGE